MKILRAILINLALVLTLSCSPSKPPEAKPETPKGPEDVAKQIADLQAEIATIQQNITLFRGLQESSAARHEKILARIQEVEALPKETPSRTLNLSQLAEMRLTALQDKGRFSRAVQNAEANLAAAQAKLAKLLPAGEPPPAAPPAP